MRKMLINLIKKLNNDLKTGESDCMFVVWKGRGEGKRIVCTGACLLSFLGFDLRCIASVFFDTRQSGNSVTSIAF